MRKGHEDILKIFNKALEAVNPQKAVKAALSELTDSISVYKNIYLLAFGKASCPMAKATIESLSGRIKKGVVITKYHHSEGFSFPENITLFEAAHPIPDDNSVKATRTALAMIESIEKDSLVLCLISGGGSALLCSPCRGLSLEDKKSITQMVMNRGADIVELNIIRKHLSEVKGGRLAATVYPAHIISLIVSDVIGDRLDIIASGPTVADPSTYRDAYEILKRYDLLNQTPEAVLNHIERGIKGEIPETPKPGNRIFEHVENHIISSNRLCLEAAKKAAETIGYKALILTDSLQGEAREAAKWLYQRGLEYKDMAPVCIISGGETTVTVRGDGIGGRNTELALSFALQIDGMDNITFLSAGTDGTDGPTDAAGAVVTGDTVKRARSLGLDPIEYLQRNDSYSFFKKTDELLITGPTGTNVMDIQITIIQ